MMGELMCAMAIPDDVRGKRKSDRRVIRTRKSIREAFEQLIKTHNMMDISVSELAREADIDRKTFYLHYNSIEDVADQIFGDFLKQALSTIAEQSEGKTLDERLDIAFDVVNGIIMSNLPFFRNAAKGLSSSELVKMYMNNLRTRVMESGREFTEEEYTEYAMRAQFLFSGTLSLYLTWLNSDCSIPIERVSDAVKSASTSSALPILFDWQAI